MGKPQVETSLLTREAILGAKDLKIERVEVPEWGGAVMVKSMTGSERDEFENSVLRQNGRNVQLNTRQMRAKLCSWTVVDEAGKRMFTESDVAALGGKSAAGLDRVFTVASRLSGISREDVEELAKNSGANLNGDSGSDSRSG